MKGSPLNLSAIRGFEAAARRLSFTGAAQEMHVTQGAISRQIATLEKSLGAALFRRLTRRIDLTEAGVEFHEAVKTALESLERSVDRIRARRLSPTITVSVLPTIGSVWLMPRLHKFTHNHPDIDVRIVTSIDPVDLSSGEAQVAIRVGRLPGQNYGPTAPRIDLQMSVDGPSIHSEELFPDILTAVVSKEIAKRHPNESTRQILAALPFIHISTRRYAWPDWLKAQGISIDPYVRSLEYGHFFMGLEEARAGRGVALAPSVVLADLDYRKRLHILQSAPVASAGSYYALAAADKATDPSIIKFMSWIKEEAATLRVRMSRVTQSRPKGASL